MPVPIDLATEQDSASWQLLWSQHSQWLRTVISARVDGAVWIDEILQNVAVQAWEKQHQLSDAEKLAPWLYRITIQQIQLFFRKSNRQQQRFTNVVEMDAVDEQQINPLEQITRDEIHQQIRGVLDELSADDREILMLKHVEGWTYRQLAERLDLTIDTVIYRLSKAKQNLKLRLHFIKVEKS